MTCDEVTSEASHRDETGKQSEPVRWNWRVRRATAIRPTNCKWYRYQEDKPVEALEPRPLPTLETIQRLLRLALVMNAKGGAEPRLQSCDSSLREGDLRPALRASRELA